MNKEYLKTPEEKFYAFKGSYEDLVDMLKSNDYEKFATACNYISYSHYAEYNVFKEQSDGYEARNALKNEANKRSARVMGKMFSDLYYMIMKESKKNQYSFDGDMLYRLFAYGNGSDETKSCIRSALSIYAMLDEGITSVDDIRTVSILVKTPPFRMFTDDKEMDYSIWLTISKLLFAGHVDDAAEYMLKMQKVIAKRKQIRAMAEEEEHMVLEAMESL